MGKLATPRLCLEPECDRYVRGGAWCEEHAPRVAVRSRRHLMAETLIASLIVGAVIWLAAWAIADIKAAGCVCPPTVHQ